jgi:FkbM family methyltransferase
MKAIDNKTPSKLAHKLSLYANEAAFAVRAPASFAQSLSLLASTAEFHYRNWRKSPLDPAPRLHVDLNIGGYQAPVTLRPRDGDLAVLYEVFAQEAYAISDELLPRSGVMSILDAGANIGLSALYMAARYPKARIFSIEPNPDNFALLKANTASEPRITPIRACVTATAGQKVYIPTSGRSSHLQMNRDGKGIAVDGISIDQLCSEHKLDRIDLLKMDVEGAEQEIFAAPTFLPKVRVIVAELHGHYTLDRFNEALAGSGFKAWDKDPVNAPLLVLAAREKETERLTAAR